MGLDGYLDPSSCSGFDGVLCPRIRSLLLWNGCSFRVGTAPDHVGILFEQNG